MRVGPEETTYEDLVGVPEQVARDARWLSGFSNLHDRHSLKRLTATCLKCWRDVPVGGTFRWDDEEVRLDDTRIVTLEIWQGMSKDFDRAMVLRCPVCGVDQRMVRKGWTWA